MSISEYLLAFVCIIYFPQSSYGIQKQSRNVDGSTDFSEQRSTSDQFSVVVDIPRVWNYGWDSPLLMRKHYRNGMEKIADIRRDTSTKLRQSVFDAMPYLAMGQHMYNAILLKRKPGRAPMFDTDNLYTYQGYRPV